MTVDKSVEIEKFSHVAMQVSDLEASLAFYHGLLGLEKVFERVYDDPRPGGRQLRIAACRVGGTVMLEFTAAVEDPQPVDGRSAPVVAFGVADIHDTHARILAAGVEPMMPPTEMEPGVFMVFVRDPDGRTIEFVQFPGGALSSAEYSDLPG